MILRIDSPLGIQRRGIVTVCAVALLLASCQTNEKKSEAVASLTPTAAQPTPSAVTPPAPGAAELTLDRASSKLEILASKLTGSHDGSFRQFSGTAKLAGDLVQAVNFDVDTASLQTDTEKLTVHMKTKDFLDVEKFPKASFKSTSVVAKPAGSDTHEITGELTLHGVTQEIKFPASIALTPDSVTGRAEVAINRQKFGIVYPGMPDDLIKDVVLLKPTFVFLRKKS